MLKNPLHEEPREQRAVVIRSTQDISLVEWLESNGRMIAREPQASAALEEEDPEILGLIDVEDVIYDMDDEEDMNLDD